MLFQAGWLVLPRKVEIVNEIGWMPPFEITEAEDRGSVSKASQKKKACLQMDGVPLTEF